MAQDTTDILRNAWATYYETLENLRALQESTPRFLNEPDNRAKAYHALLEAQAMAYRLAVPTRTQHPRIHKNTWFADVFTLGGNSPDFTYGSMFLNGARDYRITGRFGEQKMIIFQGYSHLLGHRDSKMLGNFDFSEFDLADDGSFEVIMSATEREGNWIPLDAGSDLNFFFMRRAVDDWNRDLGDIRIEALEPSEDYQELNMERQAERILLAADVMTYLVEQWNVGIYDLYLKTNQGQANRLTVVGGETIAEDRMGSPSTYYMFGVWRLEDDEAMIIEYAAPDAAYWSFQLFDVWCKSLDFVNYQTDVNMHRGVVDADGRIRYVLSFDDPGVANWLDPRGRSEGTLVGRNYLAKQAPDNPVVKVVRASEVMNHLPGDTRRVSPAERRQALAYRRESYLRMVDETR